MSSDQNHGCLGYIGDYTTQLYWDYKKPLLGSLSTNQYNGMSTGFWTWLTSWSFLKIHSLPWCSWHMSCCRPTKRNIGKPRACEKKIWRKRVLQPQSKLLHPRKITQPLTKGMVGRWSCFLLKRWLVRGEVLVSGQEPETSSQFDVPHKCHHQHQKTALDAFNSGIKANAIFNQIFTNASKLIS